jgi:hypothetical protein
MSSRATPGSLLSLFLSPRYWGLSISFSLRYEELTRYFGVSINEAGKLPSLARSLSLSLFRSLYLSLSLSRSLFLSFSLSLSLSLP